ncbi:hypothetical protein GCM10007853_20150 [Algimonas ampicilliniresistens]|jgi:hypothetical protein|uniref:Uncharacterized protein n=1 Tax=Algimonas ampicilliniresistens TaxID=1298735 RepID=A0ABQ5VC23_9PROT|nr:hypothetical protein [Algimonas ampicilliniresistens]GLQ24141.1 hypothetical protein GCM10007853_20150 [Algimonas ampicilliniresistens]
MQISSLRVARALAQLDLSQRYAKASSKDAVYLHQLGAAQRHGVFQPFDADARELNDWLQSVRAGRTLCRAAWDCFIAVNSDQSSDSASDQASQQHNSLP